LNKAIPIRTVFLDIGGVLLTDGWSAAAHKRAAKKFRISLTEIEEKHRLIFDTYEEGKLSLDDYLDQVIFYKKRRFTRAAFRNFIFEQSQPYPEMLYLIQKIKQTYQPKIVVVSNEARELNALRIRTFKLDRLADSFISSCYVHLRKPDPEIYRLALDVSQSSPREVLYIENTPMFVRIAESLGIRSILHKDYKTTCSKLASFGLEIVDSGYSISKESIQS
jgi:putative hydrolase of the HAD superfamily